MRELDVSVVIVSYNTRDVLRRCIRSLMDTTRDVTYEVIVSDNCSKDGSADMIAAEFPWVRLLRNESNLGFAAGQNRGLAEARGRLWLVSNSDIFFQNGSLDAMVKFMDQCPAEVGVIGPRVVNSDGTLAPSARRVAASNLMLIMSIINRHFHFARLIPQGVLRRLFGQQLRRVHDNFDRHDDVREPGYVDGMCILAKRETFQTAGLFDEQFFFDYEVLDWCVRVHQARWRILYYPGAEVIHLKHESRRLVKPILVETHRSELTYYSKYFPEQVPFIRGTGILVVGLRYFLNKTVFAVWRTAAVKQQCEILERILHLLRSFDVNSVSKSGIVPVMPKR